MARPQDALRRSWVPYPADSDFPIQHLPLGVMGHQAGPPSLVTAIGDQVADLWALAEMGFLDGLDLDRTVFRQASINRLLAAGPARWRRLRRRLGKLLDASAENAEVREKAGHFLRPLDRAALLLPLQIGDYTDFYSSREHAEAVGALFRDPQQALFPNWLHLPVAYHGRASSIVVSGTPVQRPCGQYLPAGEDLPRFGPTRELDFELEIAFVVGQASSLGRPVPVAEAGDHLFGLALLNDWSARDIQRWEYRPLGPFLGKNFASTLAPWITPLDALAPFRREGPAQDDPRPLPYLRDPGPRALDIELRVELRTREGGRHQVSAGNARYLYWSMGQQLAHHTVNGCNVRVGDLLATGTISGPGPGSAGSMLERTRGGSDPLPLDGTGQRAFLEDGDTISLCGWAQGDGYRIGLGKATGTVQPARC